MQGRKTKREERRNQIEGEERIEVGESGAHVLAVENATQEEVGGMSETEVAIEGHDLVPVLDLHPHTGVAAGGTNHINIRDHQLLLCLR